MAEGSSLEEAGYLRYSDVLARLRERHPAVPLWRLEQIIVAENDAITGGILQIVPVEVEAGASEMLDREQSHDQGRKRDDDEVA